MPLPPATAPRQRLHRRTIEIDGFRRADGLFDIEACLKDAKDIDFPVAGEIRPAGTPIHEMWLRVTIDRQLQIVDAEASSDAMPYRGECDRITPAYKKLIGVRIEPGFRRRVQQLLGGLNGCTHLTELALALATGAVQTLAGQLGDVELSNREPHQLDGCHALDRRGPVVAKFYPKWFVRRG